MHGGSTFSTPRVYGQQKEGEGGLMRVKSRRKQAESRISVILTTKHFLCLFVTFAFIDFSSSPLQDLGTLVEQLARFLGVSCDKAQLEGMVESCNQLIEQCCNSEALSMCRGEWERKAQLFCSGHRQHKTCTYRLRHQPLV